MRDERRPPTDPSPCSTFQTLPFASYTTVVDSLFKNLDAVAAWNRTAISQLIAAVLCGVVHGPTQPDRDLLALRFFTNVAEPCLAGSVSVADAPLVRLVSDAVAALVAACPDRVGTSVWLRLRTTFVAEVVEGLAARRPSADDEDATVSARRRPHFHDALASAALLRDHGVLRGDVSPWVLLPALDVLASLLACPAVGGEAVDAEIESLFVASVALLGSGDVKVRAKVGNEVLPAFLAWDGARSAGPVRRRDWCELLWSRFFLVQNSFPLDHPLAAEIPGFVCRLFDSFLGLEERSGKGGGRVLTFAPVKMGLDFRREPVLFELVQAGLGGKDPINLKYSAFLLKRIVDFSKRFHHQCPESSTSWSKWCLVLRRGCVNPALPIRKRFMEYIASIEDVTLLKILGLQWDFLLESFISHLDNADLYNVPGLGSFVSPFGEQLRLFFRNLVLSYGSLDDQVA
ncbi:hypothetical protein BDK51DRAFT_48801 [Blyttiomyces helicus]|uniref:Uncharacterized protein n=1 Tax=Blyttiomyces helicus TaxID=388810 RepID=A0A4P9W037_9FUNG|nr:hypothetical protein BDK51DRAFT_48801 [Blyttiomyces helicus]|eukprot:RKO84675.1 hypothetical protein BDK51DRAFT_48801 [Blyttiomyces helicus]